VKLRCPLLSAIAILVVVFVPMLSAVNLGDIFTIAVAEGTQPRDVQLRYFLTDREGSLATTSELEAVSNKLVVRNVSPISPATFRAIAYAPGCQFVTISADLALTNSAEFQCQKLPTTRLQGRIVGSKFKNLQVEMLYVVGWAERFFEVPGASVSPISLGKADVQPDGSFVFDAPDFSADPSWASLSYNAWLMFYLLDAKTGRPIGTLNSSFDTRTGFIRVESSYPGEIAFSLPQNLLKN
jgi:hypothetical protein